MKFPAKYDLSKIRMLGSVGEPINPEAWIWYQRVIGRNLCPIVDTWWQTETGAIMVTPVPGVTATKPGSCTQPLPGIFAEIVDDEGHPGHDARCRWLPRHHQAVAIDAAYDLGRQRALSLDVLGEVPQPLLRRG
jgi:acyl-coenzyme A synthetase/AMP-(fatty) acid ligase